MMAKLFQFRITDFEEALRFLEEKDKEIQEAIINEGLICHFKQ